MTDIANPEASIDEQPPENAVATRRSLVSKGLIAAAVGAAAGVVIKDPVSAANGDSMNVGNSDTGTNTTTLSGGTTFRVIDGDSNNSASLLGVQSGTGGLYGVRGTNSGSDPDGAGVYGTAIGDDVAGVRGAHTSITEAGPGVEGRSFGGAGVSGVSPVVGVLGAVSGTVDSGGSGVRGTSGGTDSIGVEGTVTGSRSVGVEGRTVAVGSTGVIGRHVANLAGDTGVGMLAVSTNGTGLRASGTDVDIDARGAGIMRINVEAAPAPAATATGTVGSIARGAGGSLWYCYETDKWRKIAGSDTAGAFHPVTAFRVYDSRREADGRFDANENRTISVADARSVTDYSVTTANAVPAGATAVAGNLLAIAPSGNGFIAINPGGTTAITSSAINFTAGQNIANGSVFSLNTNRQIEAVFGPGGGAHMAFDVTGYYL